MTSKILLFFLKKTGVFTAIFSKVYNYLLFHALRYFPGGMPTILLNTLWK